MKRERNNLAAGAFVLGGIALTLGLVGILADWERFFTPTQQVAVRFTLADGLRGLQVGAPVDVGGTPRGSVTGIRDEFDDEGVAIGHIVDLAIPADYRIYQNARIELQEPLIGAGTRLNIRSFGMPVADAEPHGESWDYQHETDPPIDGAIAGSEIVEAAVRELGIDDLQRQQLRNIIANLDNLADAVGRDPQPITATLANLASATGTLDDELPEIADNLRASTADLAVIIDDVRARYGSWLTGIDDMLDRGIGVLGSADNAIATIDDMLDENRQPLAEALHSAAATMANAEQITDHLRSQTLAQIGDMLDEAADAVTTVRAITDDAQSLLTTQRPVLERTIANARIVSDQLKLTAIEVRRAPWRLLYQPSDDELDTDNLYDAARSFALAASSLNATADSLQAIVNRQGSLEDEDDNVQRMLDNLHQVFDKFDDAENKFWQALDEMPRR